MSKLDIGKLRRPPFDEAANLLLQRSTTDEDKKQERKGGRWVIREGIKPVELYCYLNARFGIPNGVQMMFRKDDSDNLIHWHYTLTYEDEVLEIISLTFRLEIWHSETFQDSPAEKAKFIYAIKNDFSNYGKEIGEFRKKIEKWHMFVNPYFRIKRVIEHQLYKLESLDLEKIEPLPYNVAGMDTQKTKEQAKLLSDSYTEATALGLSIRMLAPVFAEAFVNLLIFLLAEDDVKNDKRVYESVVRQQIDLRIKNLHRNCTGFYQAVDYNNVDACKVFHTLMNGRNDLLHGNIEPNKLAYETVYFDGKIPLFNDYRDFSFFSWEASIRNVRPDAAINDYQVVQNLISHILICLKDDIRKEVLMFMDTKDPGWNEKTKRPGILFPGHMVDIFPDMNDQEL